MASFSLYKIKILLQYDMSTPPAGSVIECFWNSGTNSIEVEVNGTPSTSVDEIGERGLHWQAIAGVSSQQGSELISAYSFCTGTTLTYFGLSVTYPAFPYAAKKTQLNSPVCEVAGGPVCDIHFNGAPVLTHSPYLSLPSGQAIVSASSSNGTVKYGAYDFDYASDGQTSGIFNGLYVGPHTIYAKDANGCTAKIQITILYKPAPAERFNFSFRDERDQRTTTVKIYDREYIGDVVYLDKADATPVMSKKPKPDGSVNNKFYPVNPTKEYINFKSQVNFEFLVLYTYDNKRFLVVKEIDGEPMWSGYVVPSAYKEDYIHPPYTSEIAVADNVETLKTEKFEDEESNLLTGRLKVIEIIALIMKKTGLELDIQCGINIFEENHSTGVTDDPLDQTYMNLECYRTRNTVQTSTGENVEVEEAFSCWDVLVALLTPFGARIFQENNRWIIEEVNAAPAGYAYRLFDKDGVYSDHGTVDPIVDKSTEDGYRFLDQGHTLDVVPAYGKISVVSKLNYVGSIVAGGFEKTDLLSPSAEVFNKSTSVFLSEDGFKDWTLRLNGTQGVNFGRAVVNGKSVGVFYVNVDSFSGNVREAYVESAAKPLQYGPGSSIKIKFKYQTGVYDYEFAIIRLAVKLGADWLQPDNSWGPSESIYRVYPKPSGDFQTMELEVPSPDTDVNVDTTIQIRIYYYAGLFFDFGIPATSQYPAGVDGQSDFYDFPTIDIGENGVDYRTDVRLDDSPFGNTYRAFYELRIGAPASDFPNIVIPNDFDSSTNRKFWYLLSMKSASDAAATGRTRGLSVKFLLDDVEAVTLINGQDPPSTETIEFAVSKYINELLEVELYNFDVPTDIVNAKNMYNNFFTLEDGTPTGVWARSGVDEANSLQEILLKVLGINHSAPSFRVSGSFYSKNLVITRDKYFRIKKKGSGLVIKNTDFATDMNGWDHLGGGTPFAWNAANGGSAEVTLVGAINSEVIAQDVVHNGGHIQITINVQCNSIIGPREDNLHVLMWKDGKIIHTERIHTFQNDEGDFNFIYKAFVAASIDRIGFMLQYKSGDGQCVYDFGDLQPEGIDVIENYQISDYSFDNRMNRYTFELTQIGAGYISLVGIDSGGTGQDDGSNTGQQFSGAYSNAYGGAFDRKVA